MTTKNAPTPQASAPPRREFMASLLGIAALSGAALPLVMAIANRPPKSLVPETDAIDWHLVLDAKTMAKPAMRKVGSLTTVDIVEQKVDGWRLREESLRAYVLVTEGGGFQVLSALCPHGGCVVEVHAVKSESPTFFCPCHRGEFKADGSPIAGPALRGLDSLESRVTEAGLEVRVQRFRANRADKVAL